ncbi:hypothetical protein BJ742DRAFT_798428, partial [Cladochytrium replicatum]
MVSSTTMNRHEETNDVARVMSSENRAITLHSIEHQSSESQSSHHNTSQSEIQKDSTSLVASGSYDREHVDTHELSELDRPVPPEESASVSPVKTTETRSFAEIKAEAFSKVAKKVTLKTETRQGLTEDDSQASPGTIKAHDEEQGDSAPDDDDLPVLNSEAYVPDQPILEISHKPRYVIVAGLNREASSDSVLLTDNLASTILEGDVTVSPPRRVILDQDMNIVSEEVGNLIDLAEPTQEYLLPSSAESQSISTEMRLKGFGQKLDLMVFEGAMRKGNLSNLVDQLEEERETYQGADGVVLTGDLDTYERTNLDTGDHEAAGQTDLENEVFEESSIGGTNSYIGELKDIFSGAQQAYSAERAPVISTLTSELQVARWNQESTAPRSPLAAYPILKAQSVSQPRQSDQTSSLVYSQHRGEPETQRFVEENVLTNRFYRVTRSLVSSTERGGSLSPSSLDDIASTAFTEASIGSRSAMDDIAQPVKTISTFKSTSVKTLNPSTSIRSIETFKSEANRTRRISCNGSSALKIFLTFFDPWMIRLRDSLNAFSGLEMHRIMGNSHLLSIAETWTKGILGASDFVADDRILYFDQEIGASALMLQQWGDAERLLPKLGESRVSPRSFRSASRLSLASSDLSLSPIKERMPRGFSANANSNTADIYRFLRSIPPVFADAVNRDCTCVRSAHVCNSAACRFLLIAVSQPGSEDTESQASGSPHKGKPDSLEAMVRNMNRRGMPKKAFMKDIRPLSSPRRRYTHVTEEASPEIFTPPCEESEDENDVDLRAIRVYLVPPSRRVIMLAGRTLLGRAVEQALREDKRQLARKALVESVGQVMSGNRFMEGLNQEHGDAQLEELVFRVGKEAFGNSFFLMFTMEHADDDGEGTELEKRL